MYFTLTQVQEALGDLCAWEFDIIHFERLTQHQYVILTLLYHFVGAQLTFPSFVPDLSSLLE